jgi:hypothetical protein
MVAVASVENISAANIKKALAKCLPNSIRKGLDCLPRTGFCSETTHQIHLATSVQEFLAQKDIKTIHHPLYLQDLTPAEFFFSS